MGRNKEKTGEHVVISLTTAELTTRNMLRGVLKYLRTANGIACRFCLGRPDDPTLEDCLGPDCAGLVTDTWSPKIARKVKSLGIPVIGFNLTPVPHGLYGSISSLHGDLGRMAANHLAGLGAASFGYVPARGRFWWCQEREKCFAEELSKVGRSCRVFRGGNLPAWLASLKRPCAVFAATDIRAREVVDACNEAGLVVPADVAVMGVDNDELVCETTEPGLTSIEWNTEDVGYAAAELLDRAMRGEIRRPKHPEKFYYVGARLVPRASTLANFTRDPIVAKCRAIIAENIAQKITGESISEKLGVSKRTLERHFKAASGHSLHHEVFAARISAAQELIKKNRLSLDAIASRCGFYDASHLCRSLRVAHSRQRNAAPAT